MKRIGTLVIAALLAAQPSSAKVVSVPILPLTTLTTAVTAVVGEQIRLTDQLRAQCFQLNFVYGSGGTTSKVWVQTSLDGGSTWIDVANFAVTTASARRVSCVKANTAVAANVTPSDGALADNTILDGVLGEFVRTKLTSTGTYGGSTTIRVDMVAR